MTKELISVKRIAAKQAGARELYAMHHGKSSVITIEGRRCLRFTYSEDDVYQDANGATFDMDNWKWVD